MSQRLGMADGRCFTINNSSKLYDNYIMKKNEIEAFDNYKFRQHLQKMGKEILVNNNETKCGYCEGTLNLSKTY